MPPGGESTRVGLARRGEEQVPSSDNAPSHHEDLGIQYRREGCASLADPGTEFGKQGDGEGVSLHGGGCHVRAGERGGRASRVRQDASGTFWALQGLTPRLAHQSGTRGVLLPASAVTAAAQVPVWHHPNVAKFGGEAVGATHHLAAHHHRGTQAGTDGQHDHRRGAPACAEDVLCPSGGVRIVFHDDRHVTPDLGSDPLGEGIVAPSGDVGGEDHMLAVRTHKAGGGEANGIEFVLAPELCDNLCDGTVDPLCVAGGGFSAGLSNDPPGIVHDASGDLRSPDVDANRVHGSPLRLAPNRAPTEYRGAQEPFANGVNMGITAATPVYPRNLPALIAEAWTEFGDHVVMRESDGVGGWSDITGADALVRVDTVAKGLIALGVKPGERVGIMSRTRVEWTILDFGILCAGGISVPIYDTSSAEQVNWITSDAAIRLVFVETSENLALVKQVATGESPVRDVRCIDHGALRDLEKASVSVSDADLAKRKGAAKPGDLATIIYTSGTTGRPKGVELSHFNFCRHAVGIRESVPEVINPQASTLQFMTLAHVFARIIQMACLYSGTTLGYTPDSKDLVRDMGTFRPTLLVAVPRVFEKVYNGADQKATAGGKGKIFQWAATQSIAYSMALDTPKGPALGLRLRYKVADTLVLKKIRHLLGGRAKWAVSGGAPLGARLSHFYRGVGLTVLEGYGLTETTAASHVNRPSKLKIGTVGQPLPGVEIRIAADGEILMQGDIVFSGYYRNPEATAQAIKKGWFHTGDIGEQDAAGFLTITGRKKEIIVTAGGKNVAPAVLEDRVRAHPLVSQCVAVGDRKPFIGALITLDAEALPGWLKARGMKELSLHEAITDPVVRAEIDAVVENANRAVSRAEGVRKYVILPTDFTIANGYLTPSIKVKRERVLTDFADQVESIYAEDPAPASK